MNHKEIFGILKDRKVQWALTLIILSIVIFWSSSIRLSNLDNLTDATTGEKIPLALDPFYFLRISETLLENGGELPDVDSMRYPSASVDFSNEIMPRIVVWMYQLGGAFGSEEGLGYFNVISPVIFFIFGILFFFFLIFVLTKSRTIALISSIFLSFIPTYLYRTMAGFSDHESIGMAAFFLALLFYSISMNILFERGYFKKKFSPWMGLALGLLVGFLSAFSIASWGGGARFLFMIIPLSFFTTWLIKLRRVEDVSHKNYLSGGYLFYLSWFISSILFSLPYGYELSSIIGKYFLSSSGIITSFVLMFLTVDFVFLRFSGEKIKSKLKSIKSRLFANVIVSILLGLIFVSFIKGNPLGLISDVISSLLHPFGTGRVGLTVAENKQPYLTDWASQTGKNFFWMFFAGMVILGNEISKRISKKRILFFVSWIILIGGILFSRISSSSILNGTNFLSQAVYFLSVLFFFVSVVRIYFSEDSNVKISSNLIVIASWLFIMIIAGRSAIRLFFALTPFVCFMAGLAIVKLFQYSRETHRSGDNTISYITGGMFLVSLILSLMMIFSLSSFVETSTSQASSTGPSAHYQWQGAMNWVRDSTPENSIFIHWWDYGYWVQSLGKRPTVADGGHAIGYWDHLIGRYLLTTTNPQTAYSLMKTHDVSYLLIDQTDIGKYSAYSRIGGGTDESDRFSIIPAMPLDPRQTAETSEGTARVYSGGAFVDEDIRLTLDGREVFLPSEKSFIGGVIWVMTDSGGDVSFNRPVGVYYYNDQRYDIPIRYAYVNGNLLDFEEGLDAVVRIVPSVGAQNIDPLGSIVYLSPKVAKGLFAQIYLLENVFGNYNDLQLEHKEVDVLVQNLKSQGFEFGDFIYYQGAVRGPIKIWKVNYPEYIIPLEEFLRTDGSYGEFDNLKFVK